MQNLKKWLNDFMGLLGYRIIRRDSGYFEDGLFSTHSDAFRRDPRFMRAYARGLKALMSSKPESLISRSISDWNGEYVPGVFGQWRTHIAIWCANVSARLEGDFVECGVYVGFQSSAILDWLEWERLGKRFYLIDTFSGPDMSQFNQGEIQLGRKKEVQDLMEAGEYSCDLKSVKNNFSEWNRIHLIQGSIPSVLPECKAEKIAYLHLDLNCAFPEVAAMKEFWPRLVPGAVVLLDDYAFNGFDEQRLAMDKLSVELGFTIASLPTGQGLIIKSK
jgi:Macrocin-O-methyltransferase (TylF)